jgi:hypothetical protein
MRRITAAQSSRFLHIDIASENLDNISLQRGDLHDRDGSTGNKNPRSSARGW